MSGYGLDRYSDGERAGLKIGEEIGFEKGRLAGRAEAKKKCIGIFKLLLDVETDKNTIQRIKNRIRAIEREVKP